MKKALLLLVVLMTTGCGMWLRTESPYESTSLNMAVDLPSGWMRRNTGEYLLITKDGTDLQKIVAKRMLVAAEKQFAWTKKRVNSDMLPQEVVEVILDDFQSDQDLLGVEVKENAPATVGGVPGFKTRFAFRTKGGLQYQCLYYGALSKGYLYSLFYLAPVRHYFARDLESFENLARSFKLLPPAASTVPSSLNRSGSDTGLNF